MTDNEIIKALEDYRNSKIIQSDNGVISIGDILNLINRQKAEIEALKLINSTYVATTNEIRENAIKKVAESLQAVAEYDDVCEEYSLHPSDIGNLVKEMERERE